MGLHKTFRIIALVLAVLGIIFAFIITSSDEDTLGQAGSMVDNMLYVAYVILAITISIVLVYVIKGIFEGNVKKTFITLGIFFGIFLISYLLASGTDIDLKPFIDKGINVTEKTSRLVGMGLNAVYALGFIAIAVMAFSGIKKIVKN